MRRARPSRRTPQSAAGLVGADWLARPRDVRASQARFSIGACDWSIGHARQDGGVGASRGSSASTACRSRWAASDNDLQLRQPEVQRAYREAARRPACASAASRSTSEPGPYKSDPRTEQWVSDSIDVARALDVRVILLAFFERGDLRNDPDGQAEVIRRLKRVAPQGRTTAASMLGIESWLSAAEHAAHPRRRRLAERAGLLRRRQLDADGLRHRSPKSASSAASGSASSTPRKTAPCSARAASISRPCARPWTTSATRDGFKSRAPSRRASPCVRAMSRTSASCDPSSIDSPSQQFTSLEQSQDQEEFAQEPG